MARDLQRHLESFVVPGEGIPTIDYATARQLWIDYRTDFGFTSYRPLLAEPGSNRKTGLNDIPTYSLTLAQASTSGDWNVCRWSTAGCRAACVLGNGHGTRESVKAARKLRTVFLAEQPRAFVTVLRREIANITRRRVVGVRLNTASDVLWERLIPDVFENTNARFYDYTKAPDDYRPAPHNYVLSRSVKFGAELDEAIEKILETNESRSIVGDIDEIVTTVDGRVPVIDGDQSDFRWADAGKLVVLKPKGAAKRDTSGFRRIPVTAA